jgi:hypothetical protein
MFIIKSCAESQKMLMKVMGKKFKKSAIDMYENTYLLGKYFI